MRESMYCIGGCTIIIVCSKIKQRLLKRDGILMSILQFAWIRSAPFLSLAPGVRERKDQSPRQDFPKAVEARQVERKERKRGWQ
jgi:hypothetical protein